MRLCQELLDNVKEAENRERLLNATVVEQFAHGAQTIRARMAAIHIAAYTGKSEVVRLLCQEYGVDVNCNTSETLDKPLLEGLTPLYWAAVNGHAELVKLLLFNNADVNANRTDGATLLYVAAQNGHTEVLKLLLDSNADVNARRHTDGVSNCLHCCSRRTYRSSETVAGQQC